jgi:TatD DNase family protein
MLIDTHCHLASPGFEDTTTADLVARALEADVAELITIGCDLEDSATNIELAEAHNPVFATVGIHPTSAHEIDSSNAAWLEQIEAWLAHPKVVALGEIGLDYYHPPRDGSSEDEWRALQDRVFRAQLDLAERSDMPVVIHQRDSYADLVAVLREYAGRVRAVFHCFTESPAQAAELIEMGFLVSFTGVVTFKNAKLVQETAASVPGGKFMVETDAPYLAPVPMRGKRCEPAYTRHTAEFIAELRGVSLATVAAQTTECAKTFFQY